MRKTATAKAFLLLLAGAFAAPAAAQSERAQSDSRSGHDLYHSFYEAWQRNDGKGSCCNNLDCRPVQFRDGANGVEIRIEELGGAWHAAPMQSILPFGSFDANAHACYGMTGCRTKEGCRPHFYCVVLPMSM